MGDIIKDIDINKNTSNNSPSYNQEKGNPFIFSRTESTHIPRSLKYKKIKEELKDAVYSAHSDGSLKITPLPDIEEEYEEEIEIEEASGIWDRLFCACLGKSQRKQRKTKSTNSPRKEKESLQSETEIDLIGPFLTPQRPCDIGKKTLVLDLDETLVHSTFQPTQKCQYVIPVEIEGNTYNVFVFCRPGACEFIERMSKLYEVIIYTASLKLYADPLLDQMDPNHYIAHRLFRDHCVCSEGVYVKDLGLLGRDLSSIVMIDNASISYKFQPNNGIQCVPFIDDFKDNELKNIEPFLEDLATKPDVRLFVKTWNEKRERESELIFSDSD